MYRDCQKSGSQVWRTLFLFSLNPLLALPATLMKPGNKTLVVSLVSVCMIYPLAFVLPQIWWSKVEQQRCIPRPTITTRRNRSDDVRMQQTDKRMGRIGPNEANYADTKTSRFIIWIGENCLCRLVLDSILAWVDTKSTIFPCKPINRCRKAAKRSPRAMYAAAW